MQASRLPDGVVTFEIKKSDDHPWMKIVDLGGGAALNVKERLVAAGAQEVGEIQPLGDELSLFFRDPDGMELEVCCSAD